MHTVQMISEKIWQAKQENDMESVQDRIAANAHFVHMGITLDKVGEIEAFDSQKFIYEEIKLVDERIEDFGQTVVLYKKLLLKAIVKGHQVENPFVVTEVFSVFGEEWLLVTETYTKVATELTDYRIL